MSLALPLSLSGAGGVPVFGCVGHLVQNEAPNCIGGAHRCRPVPHGGLLPFHPHAAARGGGEAARACVAEAQLTPMVRASVLGDFKEEAYGHAVRGLGRWFGATLARQSPPLALHASAAA